MQRFTDQQYLKKEQYKDSSNLDARVAIHQRFSTNPQGWYNWIFDELVKLPADAKILELGSDPAYMWKECANRIPDGWVITLTDLSDGMIDSAWRNLVPIGRNFKFEQMDAQSISYEDETFDAVIANHMLYHVPNSKKALSEIKRVLKNGGVLFATTVGKTHMQEMWNWILRASGGKQGMINLSFTLENGKEQLQEIFPSVELTRYSDNLRVTDLEVIMAYLYSMGSTKDLIEEQFISIKHELADMLKKNGEIFITKDSGMFKAVKK
jgi:ubiquinone/menaquinone biosynthesis C-methylase UbiE